MSEYLDAEAAAQAAGVAPRAAPIYPLSPADERNAGIMAAYLSTRAGATLPRINTDLFPPASFATKLAAAAPLDPLERLELYPQTINSEYLKPMSAEIDAAVAAGDLSLLIPYSERINPEYMVELRRRAAAAQGDVTPTLTSITGSVTTNNAVADGTATNAVAFVAHDQNGNAMPNMTLAFTTTGAATLTSTTGSTDATGSASATLHNTTAETNTVTAAFGGISGSADVTFAAAS